MSQRVVPTWAPRVAQWKIRRLYEADVRGIYDEDPINEVGYSLLARGESFVQAVDAVSWSHAYLHRNAGSLAGSFARQVTLSCTGPSPLYLTRIAEPPIRPASKQWLATLLTDTVGLDARVMNARNT